MALVVDANRFPLPEAVVDVSAEPNGKLLQVKWRDANNKQGTVCRYHIYVDNNPPLLHKIDSDDTDGNDGIKVNIQDSNKLIGWKPHNIRVCAVNLAGLEGPLSAHVPVVMNQHPPTVKPMGVELNATSKSTIILSFDFPKGLDKMEIDMCHVTGQVEGESYTNMVGVKICKGHQQDRGFVILENIDPTKLYEIYLSFSNKFGCGSRCKKPVTFKIEDLKPSAPLLEVESSTKSSITVKCKVELHAGAVKLYNLYMSQGRKRWVPIASFDSEKYEVKNLESGTTYNFYVKHGQFKSEIITATTKST